MNAVTEPGTLALVENEILRVEIDGESYRIEPREVRALLFHGRVVPIIQVLRKSSGDRKDEPEQMSIEGHTAINRAGKAVILYTRAGHFIIPLVSFQRVARGKAVSATIKCHDPSGEIYYVVFSREEVRVTSYEADAILATVEAWADTVAALA